jgi:hypothetical protein
MIIEVNSFVIEPRLKITPDESGVLHSITAVP